jgi:8-oxo-dGTP diphosphatase
MKKKYCYDYARPAVTVDIIVVTREKRPRVLLIRRKHEPFAGCWALPGGFVDEGETVVQAARRELHEETGLKLSRLEQLFTFGDPGRGSERLDCLGGLHYACRCKESKGRRGG